MNVSVHVTPLGNEQFELVLEAAGAEGTWWKVYDGSLFLSMDAQSLELLEESSDGMGGRPGLRIKQAGAVQVEQLERMRFERVRR